MPAFMLFGVKAEEAVAATLSEDSTFSTAGSTAGFSATGASTTDVADIPWLVPVVAGEEDATTVDEAVAVGRTEVTNLEGDADEGRLLTVYSSGDTAELANGGDRVTQSTTAEGEQVRGRR